MSEALIGFLPAAMLTLPLTTIAGFILVILLLKLAMLNPVKVCNTVRLVVASHQLSYGSCRVAIETLSRKLPEANIHIYMAKPMPQEELKQLVLRQFGIKIVATLSIIRLQHTEWLSASKWPYFTLLGQTLAASVVGFYAACRFVPEVWVDTTGQVGPYPLLRLAGARVVAYVHYPTISTDMLARVSQRQASYNNSAAITSSPIKSWAKTVYYRAFSQIYGALGGFSSVVLVNSNWTRAHVERIWWGCSPSDRGAYQPTRVGSMDPGSVASRDPQIAELSKQGARSVDFAGLDVVGDKQGRLLRPTAQSERATKGKGVTVVFPPCDVSAFAALPLQRGRAACIEGAPDVVLCSVGQFRPEKNHSLQLRALKRALDVLSDTQATPVNLKLVLIGGCRDQADRARAEALAALAHDLQVSQHVQLMINASFSDVMSVLSAAVAGLHSMTDEHFGISVVEYLAAGCIPIAHDSGGPKQDIVVPALRAGDSLPSVDPCDECACQSNRTPQPPPQHHVPVGFLAHDEDTYASCIIAAVRMRGEERTLIAGAGRQRAACFSHEQFSHAWMSSTAAVLPGCDARMGGEKQE